MNRFAATDSSFSLVGRSRLCQLFRMDTPSEIVLTSIDPSRNRARFYVLSIQPTLFGEHALMRQWGRIGTHGRCRLDLHATAEAARQAMNRLAAAKRRRGYE